MLELGFVKNIYSEYVNKKTGWFMLMTLGGCYKLLESTFGNCVGKQFKYVHELQNLYYALTHIELEYEKKS